MTDNRRFCAGRALQIFGDFVERGFSLRLDVGLVAVEQDAMDRGLAGSIEAALDFGGAAAVSISPAITKT